MSGNFYNMQPAYYPIENKVDIVITEMGTRRPGGGGTVFLRQLLLAGFEQGERCQRDAGFLRIPDGCHGIQRFDKDGAAYIHILNYRYEEAADRVKPVDEIELILRDAGDDVTVLTLYGAAAAEVSVRKEDGRSRILLRNAGLYTVVCIKELLCHNQ